MKPLVALAWLLVAPALLGGIVIEPVTKSQTELVKVGIRIHKIVQEGSIPACVVEIDVAPNRGDGTFRQSILVVPPDPVTGDALRNLDSYLEDKATRTDRTQKAKSSFAVFGKEMDRAYIAIEVLVGFEKMAIYHRYLLPVSEMKSERAANQLSDPTSPSVTPPAGAGVAPSVAADH